MLKHARKSLLNLDDVNILNAGVATNLPNFDFNNTVVVVWKNRMKHLINYPQTQNLALSQNLDLILISAENSQNEKDGDNLIQHENSLGI